MNTEHDYVLIVAGGSGTRLYPRSRENRPKQFQAIIGKKTLIEETFDRAIRLVDINHIYISINKKYRDLVKQYIPQILERNIIIEPIKRNTAPAMTLATAIILKKDPKAIIASLHSDHLVLRPDIFTQAIKSGFSIVKKDKDTIVTIGIHPTSPHTGYGYIEKKGIHSSINDFTAYNVKRFVEKPDRKTALEYLRQGTFYWNAGYFIWSAKHLLKEIKKFEPTIYKKISLIIKSHGTSKYEEVLEEKFTSLPEIAIDTAVMERTNKLVILPADLGWSDVGSWDSVSDLLDNDAKTPEGNYSEGLVIPIDTHNSVILSNSSQKLVATIGLDNIIVVITDDVLVISQKGRTEEIKKVVEELKKKRLDHLI